MNFIISVRFRVKMMQNVLPLFSPSSKIQAVRYNQILNDGIFCNILDAIK